MRIPEYVDTNESLEAIVRGLDLCRKDDILAVCGSGYQPFAMLEYAKSVLAFDMDKDQIEYAKFQRQRLYDYRYQKFLHFLGLNTDCNDDYFDNERLSKIRNNLGRLKFRHANIDGVLETGRYDKIYLSNALTYEPEYVHLTKPIKPALDHSPESIVSWQLIRANDRLKKGGLIYITDSEQMKRIMPYFSYACKSAKKEGRSFLEKDCELTAIARSYEPRWKPIVYRKIR
jgi:hypothetical protein